MCAGLQHADATVAQTVQEVKAKGVDGVNIDYEGLDGSCGFSDSYWAQHAMTAFAQKMRAGLGSSFYLSVDTYAAAASDGYGFFDVAGLAQYVDSFFVMAYDLEYSNYSRSPASCSSFCLGPTAPLSGYYYNDSNVASQYVAVVGASKVILGVPYYGRKSCVGGAVPNAYPTSGVSADSYLDASSEASDPAVRAGSYVTHRDTNSSGTERWDTWYNTTLSCTRELYWDDAVSLGKKYDLVNSAKLRGAGIWNLNYGGGAPELWSALSAHFAGCSGLNVAITPASPANVASPVTITGTASGCPNPRYQFWTLAPGGIWTIAQAYSSTATYAWKTAGLTAGAYRYSVWVRDAASPAAYDTYFPGAAYTLISPCTSATDSAAPASTSLTGTTITFTATAAGCPNPRYEFWVLAGGGAWTIAQAYSTNATFTWKTTGLAAGTYRYSVWARDASSSAAYDAYFPGAVYTLDSPCTSANGSAAPASTSPAGTTVTFTGSAAGCPNPLYEFWILPPSGGWTIAQAYSKTATFTWKTTGLVGGTYRYSVWTRDSTSAAAYDAYFPGAAYALVSPCTSVNETAAPTSTAPKGTTVTLTASASGCPKPLYEFWILPPGGSWTIKQAFSSSATFTWNTSGLAAGAYRYSVWARDAGSAAGYDAYFPGTGYGLT
jgi:hypothetical protein